MSDDLIKGGTSELDRVVRRGCARYTRCLRIAEDDATLVGWQAHGDPLGLIRKRIVNWAKLALMLCENFKSVRSLTLPFFIPSSVRHCTDHYIGQMDEVDELTSDFSPKETPDLSNESCCLIAMSRVIITQSRIMCRLSSQLSLLAELQLDMSVCQLLSIVTWRDKKAMTRMFPQVEALASLLATIPSMTINLRLVETFPGPLSNITLKRIDDQMILEIGQTVFGRDERCCAFFNTLRLFVKAHALYGNPIHHLNFRTRFPSIHKSRFEPFTDDRPDEIYLDDSLDQKKVYDCSMKDFLCSFDTLQTVNMAFLAFRCGTVIALLQANKSTLQELRLARCALNYGGQWGAIYDAIGELPNLQHCNLYKLTKIHVGPNAMWKREDLRIFDDAPTLWRSIDISCVGERELLLRLHKTLKTNRGFGVHSDPDPVTK